MVYLGATRKEIVDEYPTYLQQEETQKEKEA